jgi:hypothetical protein
MKDATYIVKFDKWSTKSKEENEVTLKNNKDIVCKEFLRSYLNKKLYELNSEYDDAEKPTLVEEDQFEAAGVPSQLSQVCEKCPTKLNARGFCEKKPEHNVGKDVIAIEKCFGSYLRFRRGQIDTIKRGGWGWNGCYIVGFEEWSKPKENGKPVKIDHILRTLNDNTDIVCKDFLTSFLSKKRYELKYPVKENTSLKSQVAEL